MAMRWRGHDVAFTQPERHGQTENLTVPFDVHAKKRLLGFPLWGGDKTWLAPQSRWTEGVPFLDLDSGSYETVAEQDGSQRVTVRMISPICRETGMQITRTLARIL
jgi:hypothetical protein